MSRKHRTKPSRSTDQLFSGAIVWDLTQVNFVVNNDQVIPHSPEVERILDRAIPFFRNQDAVRAMPLYEQALALEPDKPDLLNNLATCYALLGRNDEALALLHEIHRRFPDYLFARTNLARQCLRRGELAQAAALLEPLLSRRKFHYSEFDSLCSVMIELLLLQKQPASARTWLEVWEDSHSGSPRLSFYRDLLDKFAPKD